MDVAELRVSVTKIPDLSNAKTVEAVVALAEVTLFVLPLAVCNAEDR